MINSVAPTPMMPNAASARKIGLSPSPRSGGKLNVKPLPNSLPVTAQSGLFCSAMRVATVITVKTATNTVAITAWHIAGNLKSRFTDFLTSDGEKPWRDREQEFAQRTPTQAELTAQWEAGWSALRQALSELNDEHLEQIVVIRGGELTVQAALHRSLAHTSYHVGQIVQLAKAIRAAEWNHLSIPPGGSEAYNKNPNLE